MQIDGIAIAVVIVKLHAETMADQNVANRDLIRLG